MSSSDEDFSNFDINLDEIDQVDSSVGEQEVEDVIDEAPVDGII